MMVYICTKFHENILNDKELQSEHETLTDGQTGGRTYGQSDGQTEGTT